MLLVLVLSFPAEFASQSFFLNYLIPLCSSQYVYFLGDTTDFCLKEVFALCKSSLNVGI